MVIGSTNQIRKHVLRVLFLKAAQDLKSTKRPFQDMCGRPFHSFSPNIMTWKIKKNVEKHEFLYILGTRKGCFLPIMRKKCLPCFFICFCIKMISAFVNTPGLHLPCNPNLISLLCELKRL